MLTATHNNINSYLTPNMQQNPVSEKLKGDFPYIDIQMLVEIFMFVRTMLPGTLNVFQINREILSLDDATLVMRFKEFYYALKKLKLRKDIKDNNLARAIVNQYITAHVHRYTSTKEENRTFARLIKEKQRDVLVSELRFWTDIQGVLDDGIVQLMSDGKRRLPAQLFKMWNPVDRIVSNEAMERMYTLEDTLELLDATAKEDKTTTAAKIAAVWLEGHKLWLASQVKNSRQIVHPKRDVTSPFPMDSLPTSLQTEVLKHMDRLTLNNFASTSKGSNKVLSQSRDAIFTNKFNENFPFADSDMVYGTVVFLHTMLPGVLDVFKLNREIASLDDATLVQKYAQYLKRFTVLLNRKDIKPNPVAHAVVNFYLEKTTLRLIRTKEENQLFAKIMKWNDRDDLETQHVFWRQLLVIIEGGRVQIVDGYQLPKPLLSKWTPINRAFYDIASMRFT